MDQFELKKDDKENIKEIAKAFKQKKQFEIITDDESFNPLGFDKHSAEVWLTAAGGGFLMLVGAGSILLAFLDPEPTTKLGALVIGGTVMTLAGGGFFYTILISRRKYTSTVHFDVNTMKFTWTLTPYK